MVQTSFENVYIDGEDIYRIINGKYHKLSKWIDNTGYYQVVFRINGKRKYVRIHRLIAETLIPNPKGLKQVNHIDGNKLNNTISNLEWVSNAENTQYGYDNNLYHSKKRSHAIKTTSKDGKVQIFKSIRMCSEQLGLNRKTITAILKGTKTTNNYDYKFQYI